LLLNALERQRVSSRPANYSILTFPYFGTSPYLSSMICSSTSKTSLILLVDRFFPSFAYIFVISVVFLYLTCFATLALLEDRFFCILSYTLVKGCLTFSLVVQAFVLLFSLILLSSLVYLP
jgi:hypothetical protein